MSKVIRVIVLGIVATVSHNTPLVGQNQLTKEDLLRGWKSLDGWDRTSRSYQVKQINVVEATKPPGLSTVKTRSDRWLNSTVFRETRSLYTHAPEYFFLLWQEPSNPSWVLKYFEDSPANETAERNERATGQYILVYPLSTFIGLEEKNDPRHPSLFMLGSLSKFDIKSLIPIDNGLFQVDFRFKSTSGSLTVDPRHSCMVVRSNLVGEKHSPTSRPWTLELKGRELHPETSPDGIPRCKSIEFAVKGENGKILQHERYEFTDYLDNVTPDQEFRLSHYGLPEPHGIPSRNTTPRYVWLLLGAAILAALSILLRQAARRRPA